MTNFTDSLTNQELTIGCRLSHARVRSVSNPNLSSEPFRGCVVTMATKPISRSYVHRLLATKFKKEYEAGRKERKAARKAEAK